MCKLRNPCNCSYKHRCFLSGGNNTSPSLKFLSLKLDIGWHEPTIMHNAPSWSYNLLLGQIKKSNREHATRLKHKYIKENQIYNSSQYEPNLIIHQIPANAV